MGMRHDGTRQRSHGSGQRRNNTFAILWQSFQVAAKPMECPVAVAIRDRQLDKAPTTAFDPPRSILSTNVQEEAPVRNPERPRPAIKLTGITLISVGMGLVALSLAADLLNIGGGEGFGYQQLIVLIVGIVLILGGLGVVIQTLLGTPPSHQRRDAFDLDR